MRHGCEVSSLPATSSGVTMASHHVANKVALILHGKNGDIVKCDPDSGSCIR